MDLSQMFDSLAAPDGAGTGDFDTLAGYGNGGGGGPPQGGGGGVAPGGSTADGYNPNPYAPQGVANMPPPPGVPGHYPPPMGGMGQGHLGYRGAKLLAICDVDRNRLSSTLKKCTGDVKAYTDYREILARPDIDIVHIPTPPHWHGLISIQAAEAGKDIWCEKPMTRTIGEGKKVVEAVQRNDRIFRLNTWFRFQGGFYGFGTPVAPIKKLVESGLLGWPLKATVSGVTGFNWKFM